jgi:hypothetical protein
MVGSLAATAAGQSRTAVTSHLVNTGGAATSYSSCRYRGQLNKTDLTCACVSGFTGPDCSQRLCAVGNAWTDYATGDGEAHARWTECSNMGYCDRNTGACECRAGFEGAACQLLACPRGDANGEVCSGNGRCMSMRQAGRNWNGRNLIRPGVTYDNWDADQAQGCVCDEGWSGHDCSQKECPRGDDPLTTYRQWNEKMQIACRADGGSWFFHFKGVTSKPIPFDAGFGTVERILEEMETVADVDVSYSSIASATNGPACGASNENVITIEFLQQFGELPAARVDGTLLTSSSGGKTLDMISNYWLECGPGTQWGGVYLTYDDSLSPKIPHFATATQLKAAIEATPGVNQHNPYGNATVTVTMQRSTICTRAATSWTNFTLRSPYGNLFTFGHINGLKNQDIHQPVNFTVFSYKGTKENALCSNHGICDRATGSCQCSQQLIEGTTQYLFRWSSSDGYGNKGTRGDCGYEHTFNARETMRQCPSTTGSGIACNGRGMCSNATYQCTCFHGFFGPGCEFRSCSNGSAWFDEVSRQVDRQVGRQAGRQAGR